MRPEGTRVWRKTTRRSKRGRRRGQRGSGIDSAKFLRRLKRFHDLRQHGWDVYDAARRLGMSELDGWRFEDFLTDLIHDLKTEAVPAGATAETAPTAHHAS